MFGTRKRTIGLDISDHTIEVVEMVRGSKVVSKNRVSIPAGVVEHGRIKDAEALKEVVMTLFEKAKPAPIQGTDVFFSLPEILVYTHVFTLDNTVGHKDIDSTIRRMAERNIPVISEQLLFESRILQTGDGQKEVSLIATDSEAVQEWYTFFESIGMKIVTCLVEPFSVFAAVTQSATGQQTCLVDIGSRTTSFYYFDQQGLRYTRTFHIAGDAFTQVLEKAGVKDPESVKQSLGLKQKTKKATNAIEVVAKALTEKLRICLEGIQLYTKTPPDRILLVGGSAEMPGLVEYLSESLQIKCERGATNFLQKDETTYLCAIGSAYIGLDKKRLKNTISFSSQEVDHASKKETEVDARAHDDVIQEKQKSSVWSIVALVCILVAGVVALWFAYTYREQQRAEVRASQQEELQTVDTVFTDAEMKLRELQVAEDEALVSPPTTSTDVGTVTSTTVDVVTTTEF